MFDISRLSPVRLIPALSRRVKEIPFMYTWFNSEKGKKLHSYYKDSLKDRHKGERLFLIANGPSINKTDLSLLKDEYTMCMNRFYIKFDDLEYTPNYLVCAERFITAQFAEDFENLPCETFFSWEFNDTFTKSNFVKQTFSGNIFFQNDITKPICYGGTVTYVCLQIAFYMGFEEVILVGLDHSFKEKGRATKMEVRTYEKDESHFDPNYFPKGIIWKLPDLKKSEYSYVKARAFYEKEGRKILDATIGGHCENFAKVDYNSLFNK
jgi:hypothetical protein